MHYALNMNKSGCNPILFKDSCFTFYHEDDISMDSKASLGDHFSQPSCTMMNNKRKINNTCCLSLTITRIVKFTQT